MDKILIIPIRFSYLNKETHYAFLVMYTNLLKKYPRLMPLIEPSWGEFNRLLELEANIVDSSKKSPITERLKELDERIDRVIVSINAAISSYLHHFNPEMVDAAKILRDRIKNFGSIPSKVYKGESAAVQLLLRDLQGALVPQVNIIGIADRVTELASAEALFTQLFDERNAELAGRLQMNLKEEHTLIEPVYRSMIANINANITINNDADCIEFAKELNEQVKYFTDHNGHNKPKRIDLKESIIATIPDQLYTGQPIAFIPNVRYEDTALVFGTDFTVSFKNNTHVGNASLRIRGLLKYKNDKIVTFNIIKN